MSKPRQEPALDDAIGALCPSCGMCCNGVLFGDVELLASDLPEPLRALGLKVTRKGRKLCLRQPCSCLGTHGFCQIYSHRPERCRTFECRILRRVAAGEIPVAAGLRLISRARRAATAVEELLAALSDHDCDLPLMKRYVRVMRQPLDLADEQMVSRRSELMRAMQRLMELLGREFLQAG